MTQRLKQLCLGEENKKKKITDLKTRRPLSYSHDYKITHVFVISTPTTS